MLVVSPAPKQPCMHTHSPTGCLAVFSSMLRRCAAGAMLVGDYVPPAVAIIARHDGVPRYGLEGVLTGEVTSGVIPAGVSLSGPSF